MLPPTDSTSEHSITYYFLQIAHHNKYDTSLAAKGPLAHRLQCHNGCKTQNGDHGAPKLPTGLGYWCSNQLLLENIIVTEKNGKNGD